MVHRETGRFPLYIIVFTRVFLYWVKLKSTYGNKIVNILCKYMCTMYTTDSDTVKIHGLNVFKIF